MKYDVLRDYRGYLEESLRPETVRTYYNRLECLLEGQSLFDTLEKLDMQKVLDNLAKIKHKNHFSQSKNAFLYFLESQDITLDDKFQEQLDELEKNTRNKYRKPNNTDFNKTDKTIKHLKNQKLKLSYQTLLETGLRVSELSQLTKEDTIITDDAIQLSFTSKGGNKEEVTVHKEENFKLFNDLKERIKVTQENKKLFYSSIYLQKKAKELEFTCHDLRRACAKIEYKKTKSKDAVRRKLRHTTIKTTNIYLKSKIKI